MLTQFLSTPTAVPDVTIPDDEWARIVDDGGVLREDVSCSDTVTVTQKYCGAIQQNVGVAPRISDFAPCCGTERNPVSYTHLTLPTIYSV